MLALLCTRHHLRGDNAWGGGSGAAPPLTCPDIDSDEEFYQNQEDATAPEGETLTPSAKNLRKQAEKIREDPYREAFLYVHGLNPGKGRKKKVITVLCVVST